MILVLYNEVLTRRRSGSVHNHDFCMKAEIKREVFLSFTMLFDSLTYADITETVEQ